MDARTQRRAQLIRAATPSVLEELFEMQNRLCDLCGQEIQDVILAALDHSTPVIFFARSDMPIEEATAQANDPKNLRCAHASCNKAKCDRTREDWFTQGLNNRKAPRRLTVSDLSKLRASLALIGQSGGRKSIELHGNPLTKESRAQGGRTRMQRYGNRFTLKDCKKGGRIGGPKGGHTAGRQSKKNGTGIFALTYEQRQEIGRKRCKLHGPPGTSASRAKGGRIQGPRNVKTGILTKGRHTRWHVRRNIVNPNCKLCHINPN